MGENADEIGMNSECEGGWERERGVGCVNRRWMVWEERRTERAIDLNLTKKKRVRQVRAHFFPSPQRFAIPNGRHTTKIPTWISLDRHAL